jgi:2,4-dienoyl-CoA reductase-like NADH-dependent reductase (Old Yellow Enzyme family)
MLRAEKILQEESADVILLGRALLREPTWPQRAAFELGDDLVWPPQYRAGRRTRSSSTPAIPST